MKNVTIVLDEDVARWARVWAAKHETSVSRMLGEELKKKMQSDRQYERAMRQFFSREPKDLKPSNSRYGSRDALYER